jgi:hypothetical protein
MEISFLSFSFSSCPIPFSIAVPLWPSYNASRASFPWPLFQMCEKSLILLQEDAKLVYAVTVKGSQDWSAISSEIPGRIGKQCRERWFNHLHPGVRKDPWTPEEDRIIIEAHAQLGNEWTSISKLLDGRPANAVKNHWNATLKRQVQPEMRGIGRSPVVAKRGFNDEYTSKVSASVPANLRRSARPKKRRNFDFSDDEEESEWSSDNPASSGSLTHELKEEKQQEKADAFSVAESILSLFAMATATANPLQPTVAEQSPMFANSYSSPPLASTPALAFADSQSSSSNDSVSKCSLRFLVSNENPAKHQRISAPQEVQAEQSFVFSFQ